MKIPHKADFKEHIRVDNDSRIVCEIGSDIWIATGVIIAIGKKPIRIGNGAVIAAGAVVTEDVPDYAIVGGCPAKIIRYRFEEGQRNGLLKTRWWEKDTGWINSHIELYDDVDEFIRQGI